MRNYQLKPMEQQRLEQALIAVFAIPFIDDVEDFVWEAIFAYVRDLPLVDPLLQTRSKRLFDLVDPSRKIGWSAKALQWSVAQGGEFELVIQRADIFKKATILGFERLTLDTPPSQLGQALLRHWYQKVAVDAEFQGVEQQRIAILLKSTSRQRFAFYEADLHHYVEDEIEWRWTDTTKTGLQGSNPTGRVVFRWYPNQKQLFERFILPADTPIIALTPRRLPLTPMIEQILRLLNNSE